MLIQVAFRNFTRNSRRFLLLGLAICAGYFFVCSVQSLVSGLSMQINIRGARYYGGHVIVSRGNDPADAATLAAQDRAITDAIHRSGVKSAATSHRYYYGAEGVVFFNGESVPMRRVIGMDWKTEGRMISGLQIISGNAADMSDPQGAMISEVTARRLGARVGDEVTLQVNRGGGAVNTTSFWVKAIFREVSIFGYYTLYVDRSALNLAMGLDPSYFATVGVYLDDYRSADRAAAAINRELGGAFSATTVVTFMTEIRTLLRALSTVSYGVLALLAVVVAVGILNLYRVIIYERTREIGTMRAIGIQRPQVTTLILLEAAMLAICGIAGGVAATFLILTALSLVPLSGSAGLDIFLDRGHLSWVMNADIVAADALLIVLVTLAGAFGPARAARNVEPVVAMRTD